MPRLSQLGRCVLGPSVAPNLTERVLCAVAEGTSPLERAPLKGEASDGVPLWGRGVSEGMKVGLCR